MPPYPLDNHNSYVSSAMDLVSQAACALQSSLGIGGFRAARSSVKRVNGGRGPYDIIALVGKIHHADTGTGE